MLCALIILSAVVSKSIGFFRSIYRTSSPYSKGALVIALIFVKPKFAVYSTLDAPVFSFVVLEITYAVAGGAKAPSILKVTSEMTGFNQSKVVESGSIVNFSQFGVVSVYAIERYVLGVLRLMSFKELSVLYKD